MTSGHKRRQMIKIERKELGRLEEHHLLILFEALCAVKFPNEKPRAKMKEIIGCSLPHYDNAKIGKTWIGAKAWVALEKNLESQAWSQWVEIRKKQ